MQRYIAILRINIVTYTYHKYTEAKKKAYTSKYFNSMYYYGPKMVFLNLVALFKRLFQTGLSVNREPCSK